jgi:geranylgeranyl pyrophosphate synthase
VERALEAALPSAGEPPARLHAAMRHLLFPGGKRLRPAFALAAAEAVGAPAERALPVAAAVELVHTYSLVHDDLPCMDDDALRRGRPTVHVAFDEGTAVLAGDALLAAAFATLASDADPASAGSRLAAAADLAEAAGSRKLVGGQAEDLRFDEEPSDAERMAVGVAFQIADDVLDADEDAGCSLVRLIGSDAARRRAEELLARGLAEVEDLGSRAEPLRELARLCVRRSV